MLVDTQVTDNGYKSAACQQLAHKFDPVAKFESNQVRSLGKFIIITFKYAHLASWKKVSVILRFGKKKSELLVQCDFKLMKGLQVPQLLMFL